MKRRTIKTYEIGEKINAKQEFWIDEYIKTNNLTTATISAGYSSKNPRAMGYLNSIKFKKLIDERRLELSNKITSENIAELTDIFEFWTGIFKDENAKMYDRIKASELLCKSKGGFIEKREVKIIETDWFKD